MKLLKHGCEIHARGKCKRTIVINSVDGTYDFCRASSRGMRATVYLQYRSPLPECQACLIQFMETMVTKKWQDGSLRKM